MSDFDMQRFLEGMEGRIRAEIAGSDERTARAIGSLHQRLDDLDERRELNTVNIEGHAKRLDELEGKAKYILGGFVSLFLAAVGFIWHLIVTSIGKG